MAAISATRSGKSPAGASIRAGSIWVGDSTFIATGLADLSSSSLMLALAQEYPFFQFYALLYSLSDGLWSGHLAGPLADLLAEVRHPLLRAASTGPTFPSHLTPISQQQAIELR
ncbi:hypothetical protein [Novosphingobium sp. KN65.2]|uniref:hypothetical protein n=1 Tax=Novosphingobium sp. KN65.2 TaxID=1478134 RepID=UPI0018D1A43C|nr:hypothetical protein [Novosphingobium sp. KN65.2]